MLLGVDDMDVFKGIELKLQAYERLLEEHPEWAGKVVLAQVWCCSRCCGCECFRTCTTHAPLISFRAQIGSNSCSDLYRIMSCID